MIDWTKPIEAVHVDGRVVPVELDPEYKGKQNQGMYTLLDTPGENAFFTYDSDGRSWVGDSDWTIRNRAEPANDELAELRAFKEAAIARFPELAPVDPDLLEAHEVAEEFDWSRTDPQSAMWEGSASQMALAAIKRGRELERYAQGLTTPKD